MESKQELNAPTPTDKKNQDAGSDLTESSNAMTSSISPALRSLRKQEIETNITTFIAQLPSSSLSENAQKIARTYLNSMIAKGPEEADRALTAMKVVNGIIRNNVRHADESSDGPSRAKVSPSILSSTGLIKVVADLNLTGVEVRSVAELAIAQERSVSRVGKFVKEYAASRTAQDRELVFKSLPLEQRATVLSDVEELTNHVRGVEHSLPLGEKISLTTIERLIERTGSVDVTLDLVNQLVEFPMADSGFAYMFAKGANFHSRYNSILRYAIQVMEENDSTSFDMEAFLTSRDTAAGFDAESFMEDPREEQEAYDQFMADD